MRSNKWKNRFWGVMRVQLYVACVGGAIATASFVHAYDRAERTLGELGFDMLSGLGALDRGVEQVELNGQSFTFAATAVPDLPEAIIAEFEHRCARGSGSLATDLAAMVEQAKKRGYSLPAGEPAQWLTRTERAAERDSAHSSCWMRDDRGSGDLWASLERFADTGKLAALGGFRYVRADREPEANVTRVLAIASDGEFDFDALVPERGDARGSDPTVAPRPPEAVRQFSARIARSGHGAYVYSSPRPPADVLRHYDREVARAGLRQVALPAADPAAEYARAYAAPGGAVVVSITEDGGESRVAVFEFGALGEAGGS